MFSNADGTDPAVIGNVFFPALGTGANDLVFQVGDEPPRVSVVGGVETGQHMHIQQCWHHRTMTEQVGIESIGPEERTGRKQVSVPGYISERKGDTLSQFFLIPEGRFRGSASKEPISLAFDLVGP